MKYQHEWALIAHDLDVGLMYLCSLCFLYLSNNLENYLLRKTLISIQWYVSLKVLPNDGSWPQRNNPCCSQTVECRQPICRSLKIIPPTNISPISKLKKSSS
ncbi:hypothetical protein L1987_47266 [Smallanthus sonchifolius]|uniref:Uncharacterized protein n=1 Tax=Smallanthus sonchifolius TaxID=185202 RepID=A0ACB9G310_9ASTR|nr:hypothetical protein L1987_47266 [Smallanthus sonchifolius]